MGYKSTLATVVGDKQGKSDKQLLAIKSQIFGRLSIFKASKSGLSTFMASRCRVLDALKADHSATVDIRHDHNEHGRPWSYAHRDLATMRLNRACDDTADRAANHVEDRKPNVYRNAAQYDSRGLPNSGGFGGSVTLGVGRVKHDTDVKDYIVVRDLATHDSVVHSLAGQYADLGATSRAVRTGVVDAEASAEARTLMNPHA